MAARERARALSCTSLREAIVSANAISGGTITFNIPTNQMIGGVWTIQLASALPDLTTNVTITGSGLAVTLSGLTIRDGLSAAGSGGISSSSALTLLDCVVAGNQGVLGGGGGLSFSDGTFTRCTLASNTASVQGGGINFQGNGGHTLTLVNCTVSDNRANGSGYGGGILNVSTAGNSTLQLMHCTIASNTSASGVNGGGIAGLGLTGGTTTTFLAHTIVAQNTAPNLSIRSAAAVTSQGYNLTSDNGGGFLTQPGDQVNTDPLLGPLQNNGGPTFTQALLGGSPAIDQGKALGFTTDQRGLLRPADFPGIPNASGGDGSDGSDIGAFESQVTVGSSPLSLTGPQKLGNGAFQFAFTNTPGASFTIFTATNLALPLSNWTVLGVPAEITSDHFQFTDPQATNRPQGFYRVRSP